MYQRTCLRGGARRRLAFAAVIGTLAYGPAAAADQSFASTLVESSQDRAVLLKPAHLTVRMVPLQTALDALQESSGVAVAYSPSLLPPGHLVTCVCDEFTVQQAMTLILAGTGFEAVPVENQVVVRKRDMAPLLYSDGVAGVLARSAGELDRWGMSGSVQLSSARQASVMGRVIEQGTLRPLSGVQVHIVGTALGVLSNAEGRFIILNVPPGEARLRADLIGYGSVTHQITVGAGQMEVNFELSQNAINLDEIVVTGTPGGTVRRAMGNVVSTVDAEALEMAPSTRIESALGNKVPGVWVVGAPIMPGGVSQIRIRGSSSISLPGDPLIYVDGVRLNTDNEFVQRSRGHSRLADIDPSTIESMEIIKGPAAATLYGTEAANGVIQIITKRGREGTTEFNASAELGALYMPHPERHAGPMYFRDPDTGEVLTMNRYEADSQLLGKPMFQRGPIQRYNVGATGGTALLRYNAAFTRSNQEGNLRHEYENMDRAQTSITVLPRPNLTITAIAARSVREVRAPNFFNNYFNDADPIEYYLGTVDPPQARFDNRTDITTFRRNTWSAEIRHEVTDWFSHRLVGGVDDSNAERENFAPRDEYLAQFYGANEEGSKSITIVETPTRSLDYSASLTLPIPGGLTSVTSAGLQYYHEGGRRTTASGQGFAVSGLSTVGATGARTGSEEEFANSSLGTYVQVQLDQDNRRFLTAAVRYDDHSAFGNDFSGAVYPKVSGSWVVSDENFWRDMLGVNQFRLRAAWGQAGMQPNAFAARRLYEPQPGPGGQPILIPLAYGNPDLGPERGSEVEAGFEAGMFGGRARLDFTFYRRVTKDAIVAQLIPPSLGFPGTRFMNIGQTSNWGTETLFQYDVVPSGPVTWSSSLALTSMSSRIDKLGLDFLPVTTMSDPFSGGGEGARGAYHVEGFPIASIFGKVVRTAEFEDGPGSDVINVTCDGGVGEGGFRRAGGPNVPCEDAPRIYLGKGQPSFMVNLTQNLSFLRNLGFVVSLDGMFGHSMSADYLAASQTRWTRSYVYQDDPFLAAYRTVERTTPVFHKNGFVKLRELSLRYSLPEGLTNSMKLNRASVSAQWYNVATLWWEAGTTMIERRPHDPEMMSPEMNFPGVNMGSPPPLSHFSVKVDVAF